ncbi:MAG: hypothetical protein MUF35_00140 [Candidatus Nanopelagicales bacterium]|nr:hypothetical protein [Candidatus Nanopelagicales bacterium]
MGVTDDADARPSSGARWFVATTLVLSGALVAGGAWVNAQVPPAVALQPVPASVVVAPQTLDARAAIATDRLAVAAGRSLSSLAEQAAGPKANPAESAAPVVAGAAAATEQYAEQLEELNRAEEAAAAQLAMTEEELARAEEARAEAAEDLAEEEAAAAREVDAAIDAAIAAAQAQTALSAIEESLGGRSLAGAVAEGRSTSTDEVLDLVRAAFPANQVGNAMAVARCESGHANRVGRENPNGTRDFGVFQINDGGTIQAALKAIRVPYADIAEAREKALDPVLNVRMARAIWDARGWQPWVCASKLKIVTGLYQRAPGPMAGKYDEYGRAQ